MERQQNAYTNTLTKLTDAQLGDLKREIYAEGVVYNNLVWEAWWSGDVVALKTYIMVEDHMTEVYTAVCDEIERRVNDIYAQMYWAEVG